MRNNYCVSDPQISWGVQDSNYETNSCGGPLRLAIYLLNHLDIIPDYPFWYCCSRFRIQFSRMIMHDRIEPAL